MNSETSLKKIMVVILSVIFLVSVLTVMFVLTMKKSEKKPQPEEEKTVNLIDDLVAQQEK